MTLLPGTTLGRYQILGPLGQGGMAFVYKAYQPALDRTVALKVIRRGFAEDPEFRDRFRREARVIARLTHPNIVQVFDYDEIDGQIFLAMQYLEGGTLKDRLAKEASAGRRMTADEVAEIVQRVADALAYAHDEGVIHRDVKPSNVMLTRRGDVVVADFGIAKIVGGTQHTATGVGIGTPEYMSPEQGQGLPLDGRTDQYALAVMAYEMLTGQLPYTADTPFAVVLKHVRDPLPLPSKLDPTIPDRTEQVLLRALAKDPSERFPRVTEFASELMHSISRVPGRTLPTLVKRAPGTTDRPHAVAPALRSTSPAFPRMLGWSATPLGAAAAALLLLVAGAGAVLGLLGAPMAPPTPVPTAAEALARTSPSITAPLETVPQPTPQASSPGTGSASKTPRELVVTATELPVTGYTMLYEGDARLPAQAGHAQHDGWRREFSGPVRRDAPHSLAISLYVWALADQVPDPLLCDYAPFATPVVGERSVVCRAPAEPRGSVRYHELWSKTQNVAVKVHMYWPSEAGEAAALDFLVRVAEVQIRRIERLPPR